MALDLLAERSGRARADPAGARAARARRTGRRRSSTCRASRSSAPVCSASSGASCAATRQGWTSPEIVGALAAGAVARRAVRPVGAARRGADAADALLPQPHVRARERRVAADVLRDVRLDLPALAVLPDRAGLLAARLRPAHPAVDADADVRRADRRRAVRPDRRRAADGHRPRRCRRSACRGSRR